MEISVSQSVDPLLQSLSTSFQGTGTELSSWRNDDLDSNRIAVEDKRSSSDDSLIHFHIL